jgi:hypothetical protein
MVHYFSLAAENICHFRISLLWTRFRVTWEQVRDEVFADMYAHATGLTTTNQVHLKWERDFQIVGTR